MLGHTRLETTQRYTRVSIDRLRTVHAQTHPAAGLNVAMASELCTLHRTRPPTSSAADDAPTTATHRARATDPSRARRETPP